MVSHGFTLERDRVLSDDLAKKTTNEVVAAVARSQSLAAAALDEKNSKANAVFQIGLAALYGMTHFMSGMISGAAGRHVSGESVCLLMYRGIQRPEVHRPLPEAVRCSEEDAARLEGSTLQRGDLIEADFYRLKAQELAMGEAEVRGLVESFIQTIGRV